MFNNYNSIYHGLNQQPQPQPNRMNNIQTVLSMIVGRDPQQVFMEKAREMGLDNNAINGIVEQAKRMC